MKWTISLSVVALALSAFAFTALSDSHEEHAADKGDSHEHNMEHMGEMKPERARCAFDGTMMMPSMMVAAEHDGETFHFCNQKEADRFASDPNAYLKSVAFGASRLRVNILPVAEYKESMEDMNMGRFIDAEAIHGKTHQVVVYAVDMMGADVPLDGFTLALVIADADGDSRTVPMTYNKVRKTHEASVAELDGEPKLAVQLTTAPVAL